MFISDQNMILAFGILKESGVVKFYVEIYEILGVDKSWVHRIKNQEKHDQSYHFTVEHIRIFCDYFNINSNYIFGLESDFYRKNRVTHSVTLKKKVN